jgi:hypothetical protein
MWNRHKQVFFEQEIFAFCKSSSRHFNGWVPTSFAEVYFQETPARYRTPAACQKESPDGLKDDECEKGQLSHWLPIPYNPVVDVVTPKEVPQIFKVKLPDVCHLSMPIYSRGNNQGIPHAHCCGPPSHQAEGAAQEVLSACQGCCETVRGVEESPRSHGILRHRLDDCRCYGPLGGN